MVDAYIRVDSSLPTRLDRFQINGSFEIESFRHGTLSCVHCFIYSRENLPDVHILLSGFIAVWQQWPSR